MYFKKEFKYTGYTQRFTVPKSGHYLLEAWGAQGGNVTSTYWKEGSIGGYGAYAVGTIFLEKNRIIYVSVGQPGDVTEGHYPFNGGGAAHQRSDCYTTTSSGGGATHFSYQNNTIKNLVDLKFSILLVAAGGGGSYTLMCNLQSDLASMNGGHAGGVVGSSPVYTRQVVYSNTVPTGGTQVRGGISSTYWKGSSVNSNTSQYNGYFGQGGIYPIGGVGYSGGGGGWYGGASGQWRAGAGGSSYIAEFLNDFRGNKKRLVCYNCQTSTNKTEFTLNTPFYSYSPVRDSAKLGEGFARVTLLDSYYSCRNRRRKSMIPIFAYSVLILAN